MAPQKRQSDLALGGWVQVIVLLMLPPALWAGDVTLAWSPNSESNLAGYKLYYDGDSDSEMYRGTGANEGESPIIIGLEDLADADSPVYTLTGLAVGEFYYFALTAFNTDGLESDFSDELGTEIESDSTYNKTATDPADPPPDTSSGISGGSGSGCFISGAMGERLGSPL
jgi:hypothetical protein